MDLGINKVVAEGNGNDDDFIEMCKLVFKNNKL